MGDPASAFGYPDTPAHLRRRRHLFWTEPVPGKGVYQITDHPNPKIIFSSQTIQVGCFSADVRSLKQLLDEHFAWWQSRDTHIRQEGDSV